ncbi:hypothetical protein SAMN02910289_00834 [Lachnospiraceae bacterium RM5]|nr:hypothetical protein SAMN02910289_00834 [Lachnospiraceae bacterium RM5]
MNEEKKNLTDEERKELKANLKKQIDEMSDEELDGVAGGMSIEALQIRMELAEIAKAGICNRCNCEISDLTGNLESDIKIVMAHILSGCKQHIAPPTPGVIGPSKPINVR